MLSYLLVVRVEDSELIPRLSARLAARVRSTGKPERALDKVLLKKWGLGVKSLFSDVAVGLLRT